MTTFADFAAAFDKHHAAEMAKATDGLGPLTAACIKRHWHIGDPRRDMDIATAFALMHSWADNAPVWCSEKHPIAKALQAGVLIRTLTAEITRLDKSASQSTGSTWRSRTSSLRICSAMARRCRAAAI